MMKWTKKNIFFSSPCVLEGTAGRGGIVEEREIFFVEAIGRKSYQVLLFLSQTREFSPP
jgi:hypothetical protein